MRGRFPFFVLLLVFSLSACAPVVQERGAVRVSATLEDGVYRTSDGEGLPLRVWGPPEKDGGRIKAVVAALHGFNDYSNGFDELASFLSKRGVVFYAFDQRGFGGGPHHGIWGGVETMTRDAAEFAHLVRARHKDVPFFLFGESMGGAVLIATSVREKLPDVSGLVLIAPAVWGRETMNPIQNAALWLISHTFPAMRFSGRGLRIRASDNIEMLRALSRDPLIIKESRADSVYGLVNMMDAGLAESARLFLPTLIVYGAHDEIIPKRPLRAMMGREPTGNAPPWRLAYYQEGFHMLTRDLGAAIVWRDIYDWMEDREAPFLSRADEAARERLGKAD